MYGYLRFNNIKLEELDLLLIGAFMGATPFLLGYGWSSRIRKWFSKPKLEFKSTIEEDIFKQNKNDKEDSKRITFWVHVRNLGNEMAENCKIRLKVTDQAGIINIVEKTTHPSVDRDISVPWFIAGKKEESRDILPSKYFDSMFKIPFVVESFPEDTSDGLINRPSGSMYFEDPIKKPLMKYLITPLGNKEITIGLLIEAVIISSLGEIARQKFLLDIRPESFSFVLVR